MKRTWEIINRVIHRENDKSGLPDSFIINNQEIFNKNIIAEEFNKYFINIGNVLNSKIPTTNKTFEEYLGFQNQNSMFFTPIVLSDIFDTAKKIKTKNTMT